MPIGIIDGWDTRGAVCRNVDDDGVDATVFRAASRLLALPDGVGTVWNERVTSDNDIFEGCVPLVVGTVGASSFPSRTGNGAVRSSAMRSRELELGFSVWLAVDDHTVRRCSASTIRAPSFAVMSLGDFAHGRLPL